MKKLKNKNQAGFTLIELLVYMAVLAVVTVSVADGFLMLARGRAQVEVRTDLNSCLSFALEKIRNDIVAASSVATPAVAGTNSSLLDLSIGGSSVKYSLNNGKLERQVDSQPAEIITAGNLKVTDLSFLRLENTNAVFNKKNVSLEILISASYDSTSPERQLTQTQKTSVGLRTEL